ncbi:MAG: glycosyltransferase family 2 protein [Verrucomicrobia bacterium]|nr:glycosyltransferase family 2 protein [Verrucomicrobiota bacterium]
MTLETALSCVFWFSFLVLAYTFCGYPALVMCLSRLSRKSPLQTNETPLVSVVLAAHNEQERIHARLQNLLSAEYPADKIEIVIVSDGSTDATVDRAESIDERRVRVIHQTTRSGKAHCLNVGVAAACGEIVVFGDMRQRFAPDTIARLVSHFSDARVGAVSGSLEIERSASAIGGGVDAYWRLEKLIRFSEAQIDSSIGCTGAVYAIRRKNFQPIPSDTILDDVVIPMQIALQKLRVLFDPKAVAYDPQTLEPEREKIRKQRTLAGNFQMMFRYPGWLLPWVNRLWWQLISHKYLRLAAPFFMLLLLVANGLLLDSIFYRSIFIAQCLFYALAISGRTFSSIQSRLFSIPAGFVFLNLMILSGLYHHLRGSYRTGSWPMAKKSIAADACAKT